MRFVPARSDEAAAPYVTLCEARGINNNGWIVAYGPRGYGELQRTRPCHDIFER
jgi:hypothetical protein